MMVARLMGVTIDKAYSGAQATAKFLGFMYLVGLGGWIFERHSQKFYLIA